MVDVLEKLAAGFTFGCHQEMRQGLGILRRGAYPEGMLRLTNWHWRESFHAAMVPA